MILWQWTHHMWADDALYDVHRILWRLWPHRRYDGPRPFVWCQLDDTRVWVRATVQPNLMEANRVEYEAEIGDVETVLVVCNPTKVEVQPDGCRSKRRSLIHSEDVLQWWERQGRNHGFRPIETEIINTGVVRWTKPSGRSCLVGSQQISGSVVVLDPELWKQAVALGVGRSRAFGLGMLRIGGLA
jgi:CRISPR-associated protein Cas6/Cse3/CasE subtype I-E